MGPTAILPSVWQRALFVLLAASALPAIAHGATRSVDAGNAACSDTKGTPFCRVQAAIDASAAGDRIEIAAGSYTELLTIDRNLTLAGAGISPVAGACDGTTNLLGGPAVSVSPGVIATLTNVTVKGSTAQQGGGIMNAGVLFVSDSEVCGNSTFSQGAGIYDSGHLSLDHVQVYGNEQASFGVDGGGLFVETNGVALVTNSSFAGNHVTRGGAIFIEPGGTLVIRRSALTQNIADDTQVSVSSQGAGISNAGLAIIDETTIQEGTAVTKSQGRGAGIYNEGHLVLTRSLLYDNFIQLQDPTEQPSSPGPVFGAGLDNSGVATVASSTVSGNSFDGALLGFGAGIANTGTLSLNNVTITRNVVKTDPVVVNGAGIYLDGGGVTVRNSIVAGQIGPDCSGTVTSDGHNIDSDGTCGLGANDQSGITDPGLLPLADYGGPTLTHNLADDSPAIDAGDPAGCMMKLAGSGAATVPLATDQRGNVFVEAAGVGGDPSGCDAGAVEFNLLANGMMEDNTEHGHAPDGWTATSLVQGDRLYCFPRATYAGGCAFGMRGDASLVKQLAQAVDRAGKSGDRYSLVLHDGAALVTGSPQARVTFEDSTGGGTEQAFTLPLPTGSHADRSHSLDITTTGAYDRITVAIEAGSGGGLFIDNVSLEPAK
jgi:hypothetical protein